MLARVATYLEGRDVAPFNVLPRGACEVYGCLLLADRYAVRASLPVHGRWYAVDRRLDGARKAVQKGVSSLHARESCKRPLRRGSIDSRSTQGHRIGHFGDSSSQQTSWL